MDLAESKDDFRGIKWRFETDVLSSVVCVICNLHMHAP